MEQGIDLESLFMDAEPSMESSEESIGLPLPNLDAKQQLDANNNNDVISNPNGEESVPKEDNTCMDVSASKTRPKVEYNLRMSSLLNRVATERRQKAPKEPKPKSRPPPLSKYRRRAANARERGRMSEMNDAFEALAGVVPVYGRSEGKGKPTKITTLRLALNYIAALRETLGYSAHSSTSGFNSSGETCSSSSEASSSDTGSEGIQSPGRSHLDSEGEQLGLLS